MNKEFPQTEKQQKIYDFWNVRGFGRATAVLGNLNVSLHHDNPKYECLGINYIYLEQFYNQAQEDVISMMQKIIDSEKERCGEANAVTCWVMLKEQIIKQKEVKSGCDICCQEKRLSQVLIDSGKCICYDCDEVQNA